MTRLRRGRLCLAIIARMPRLRWLLSAIVLLITSRALHAVPQDLLAAGDEEHLWLITERPADRRSGQAEIRLAHLGRRPGQAWALQWFFALPRWPEAVAARGNTVWLAYPPTEAVELHREVYRVRARWNAIYETWFTEPAEWMESLASLPGDGELIDLAPAGDGVAALLKRHDGGTGASFHLFTTENRDWGEQPLPDAFAASDHVRLLPTDGKSQQIALLRKPLSARARIHQLDVGGTWSETPTTVDVSGIRAIAGVAGRTIIATPGSARNSVILSYVRAERLLNLGEVVVPSEPWAITGAADGWHLLSASAGEISDQLIDPLDGVTGEPVVVAESSPRTTPMILTVSLWGVMIGAMILLLLVRPPQQDRPERIPAGFVLVSPMGRLAALAVDAAPGVAVMFMLTGELPGKLPFITVNLLECVPYLGAAAITIAHSVVGEVIWNRTLGKMTIGAVLTRADGSPPRTSRLLLRNLLKLVVILMPPLAVIVVIDRHLQGLPDQVAGTLVLRREDTNASADQS